MSASTPPTGSADQVDPFVIDRIARALTRMRRDLVKPPELCVPMPSIGRSVDAAKIHACVAIAEGFGPGDGAGDDRIASVKDVAEIMHLDHSTVSRLLGEAESEGLVVRGTDPDDRRRTTVSLTDTGRLVVQDEAGMRSWAMGQIFREWSEEDLGGLAAMLERMAATLSERMPIVLGEIRERFDQQDPVSG